MRHSANNYSIANVLPNESKRAIARISGEERFRVNKFPSVHYPTHSSK